ncbi:MAG TPA: hypothetical protein PLS81_04350 [Deltaproteobacteria bacterium]|nr:hypothetical protein [Deltaproteobacteria bacterium]HOM28674.1 hypothetical protein [Deltaproteobacteria bacterium]HPP80457.1 hypothetical protein [Deltaproteobacteria bacterium]
MRRDDRKRNRIENLTELLVLSAWGAVIAIASILFVLVGVRLDTAFETGPLFMIGLLVLAVFLLVARLYVEFKKTSNRMDTMGRRHA